MEFRLEPGFLPGYRKTRLKPELHALNPCTYRKEKMKRVIFITHAFVNICFALIFAGHITAQQQSSEDLRKQIGTIIVTPGNGPALAVADFQPRASGVEKATATFNETLWNDLKFAGA